MGANDAKGFIFHYEAEPTLARFHLSDAFIRGIRGPYGSGKSVGCVAEMAMRSCQQAPDRYGVRRTRWAAIRNTYPELISTTYQTFIDWFGADNINTNWDAPISSVLDVPLEDGTRMVMEVLFIAVDRPAHIGKLKSLDLTGLWLNEAGLLAKIVLNDGAARVGRYPLKKDGAPFTWAGVIMDTNSMDDDHWWHDLDVGPDDPDRARELDELMKNLKEALATIGVHRNMIEFFDQPAALVEVNGSFFPNAEAENVKNQPMGMAYWLQLVAGHDRDWILINILNQYGRVIDGKPCYPEYNDEIHGKKYRLAPMVGLPIIIGLDYGLSPAAVFLQCTPKGQLLILGELCSEDRSMGITRFLSDALKPYLANRFGGEWTFKVRGDPAGKGRAETDEKSCEQIVIAAGFSYEGAKTNAFMARRESVSWFLSRLVDGKPAILMDESCKMLRKGFKAGYHYRRIQVSGEERFQEEAYKNKYSHPHDALQYAAMEFAIVETPGQAQNMIPAWQRKLRQSGGASRPWRHRSTRAA
jgi:hypothetical protein